VRERQPQIPRELVGGKGSRDQNTTQPINSPKKVKTECDPVSGPKRLSQEKDYLCQKKFESVRCTFFIKRSLETNYMPRVARRRAAMANSEWNTLT
jgi:hypothetical protein